MNQAEEIILKLVADRKISVSDAILLLGATKPEIQVIEKPIYYPIYPYGYYYPQTTYTYNTTAINDWK